ncbi:MAG: hypothetical protein SFX72_18865 [Isosphaeraceae bacterium]|nr:hypothetical protein [Isosphaeraceae bacterium]
MGKCDHCGEGILFGGVRTEGRRYCGAECASFDVVIRTAEALPDAEVEEWVREYRGGGCANCGRLEPIDIHESYRVHSLIVYTTWATKRVICCRSCARSELVKSAFFCFLFGWWGFPFGIIVTPVQLFRNLIRLTGIGMPDPEVPSAALIRSVRLDAASMILHQAMEEAATAVETRPQHD